MLDNIFYVGDVSYSNLNKPYLVLLFVFICYFMSGYSSYCSSHSFVSFFLGSLWLLSGFEYLGLFIYSILLFKIVLFLNFISLFPYVSCLTSQIWFGFYFSSLVVIRVYLLNWYFDFVLFIIDFVPLGCPLLLSPFLVFVELVSYWIRLFTLAVRLLIKLSAGHVLSHLLSGRVLHSSLCFTAVFVLFFFLYEVFVSFVQSRVFSILVMVYFMC